MSTNHAAVWLDHQEAHVFYIGRDSVNAALVLPAHPHRKLHRRSGPGADSGQRAKEDHLYFEDIEAAVADNEEILIVGPASAKLELFKHMSKHRADLAQKVVGVETVDHPTDRQIVAYARSYFKAVDAGLKAG